ncbi:MAG: carboxypeptidase regulatory-like domain-containing protein [Methanothrix sp.]|nr:carboxypeptidase regulatory-like domain-containing protein [Methanothrix sp.]
MRKVLAITVALMVAAIVIMPALGYTNQAAGNQSYSVKSGDKPDYSFTTGSPAHNLTADTVTKQYSFKSTAVTSTRMAYSFKQSGRQDYTFKTLGVDNAVAEGMKVQKDTALLGSMNKKATAEPVVAEAEPVAEVAAAPAVEPKFSIEGVVVDNSQTGLSGWTLNLSKDGAVVNSVASAADGKFAFADLAAGEYAVSEALADGWSIVSPAEGSAVVTITDANVTDLVFVNQLVPVVVAVPAAENATVSINETAVNTTVVDTAAVNTTAINATV